MIKNVLILIRYGTFLSEIVISKQYFILKTTIKINNEFIKLKWIRVIVGTEECLVSISSVCEMFIFISPCLRIRILFVLDILIRMSKITYNNYYLCIKVCYICILELL